ncbi:DEAD/DEAH box helicase [Gynuella sunshinyii]|uniref:Superfamily II helicase n=1 Tax=Gynuella sunshinyii YC6258 TaxID=1445510 RepID=A0A0C5V8W8_9GAMM|nr:DEAD/DEAH box helicase [Gynuella sunshinyii]AJQ95795.1 superfamily II helicase [Gynuella sunshinyii YC6258]
MSFFDKLSAEVLKDEYFIDLFIKAEMLSASGFFGTEKIILGAKEYVDLLRFADILSRAKNFEAQNKAYKTVSLLIDDYKSDDLFKRFAHSIFVKLGNFPAIRFLEDNDLGSDDNSIELVFEKSLKEIYQKSRSKNLIFTDEQYEIFSNLKNSNHYSFSGPTSLGKSFIIKEFIRYLIEENNCNENIVILVPTRALINQTLLQLKKEFYDIETYKILSHPTVPESFRSGEKKFIFIFTPERLTAYLAEFSNPKIGYLFIDEAQKITSPNDTRSPLYYHAILQAERKSIKLYFASPNIPNPEVFLQLFEKSAEEAKSVKSSPVSQNRYFLDFLDKRCLMFSDVADEQNVNVDFSDDDFYTWVKRLSKRDASIIYCNTKSDTVEYALKFSKTLPDKEDNRIDEVISVIEEHLHKKYFLIDCLKKGVAFHFGSLPQRIRERVEQLFSDRGIDFVFCTSTLLEGVNLPAKNIFILNNAIGLTKFSDIDFWNLAGRAGRLTQELSGNIICTRIEDKKYRWKNPEKDLDVVKNRQIKPIEPLVNSGRGNFYKNIEASLSGKEFTKKSATANEINIWNHYANIALIHEIRSDESPLRSNFLERNDNAKVVLQKLKKETLVPEKILSSYSMIKSKYQNHIFQSEDLASKKLSSNISYESVLEKLELLCDFYSWETEEVTGRKKLLPSRDILKYYAVLMANWMDSQPLSWMISNSIKYHEKTGVIWEDNQSVPFNSKSQKHINIVINNLISDVDNILRFKLKNYFSNYYDILAEKLGDKNAGENWGEFLEYGTNDWRIIELQNIGIPRHLANFLLENHSEFFVFEGGSLLSIRKESLIEAMDENSPEFKELVEVI